MLLLLSLGQPQAVGQVLARQAWAPKHPYPGASLIQCLIAQNCHSASMIHSWMEKGSGWMPALAWLLLVMANQLVVLALQLHY